MLDRFVQFDLRNVFWDEKWSSFLGLDRSALPELAQKEMPNHFWFKHWIIPTTLVEFPWIRVFKSGIKQTVWACICIDVKRPVKMPIFHSGVPGFYTRPPLLTPPGGSRDATSICAPAVPMGDLAGVPSSQLHPAQGHSGIHSLLSSLFLPSLPPSQVK